MKDEVLNALPHAGESLVIQSKKKGGGALITVKDIRGIFNQLRKILAMLDKIYHALGLDEEEK